MPVTPRTPWEYFAGFLGLSAPILQVLAFLVAGSTILRRNDPAWFGFSILLSLLSAGSIAWIVVRQPKDQVRGFATFVALVTAILALTIVLLLWSGSAATNFRPVITATVTGDGPVVIEGKATTAGMRATGLLALRVLDADQPIFQAEMGPQPATGIGEISYKVRVERVPDREITVIAWLADEATAVPTSVSCENVTTLPTSNPLGPTAPLFSCIRMRVAPPLASGPRMTIAADMKPGDRAVTVGTNAVVLSDQTVMLTIWDGGTMLHAALIRPAQDGGINHMVKAPISDNAASICAIAELVGHDAPPAASPPRPDCAGSRQGVAYAMLVIPDAPGPLPASSSFGELGT
jgi:hypothetical protein